MYYKDKHYVVKTYNELTKEEQADILQKELENESTYYWYAEYVKEDLIANEREFEFYINETIE